MKRKNGASNGWYKPDPQVKITVLVKENPRRQGAETYQRFELYKTCKTVRKFVESGGRMDDIKADVKRGHIELS